MKPGKLLQGLIQFFALWCVLKPNVIAWKGGRLPFLYPRKKAAEKVDKGPDKPTQDRTPRSATPSQLRVELRSSLALPSLHWPVAGPDGASRVPTLSLRTWCGLKRMGALEDREQQFWYNLPDPSVPSASGMFIRSSKPIPGNWLRSLLWGPTWLWPFSDSIPYFPRDNSRLRESSLKWAWFETTTWAVPSSILSR